MKINNIFEMIEELCPNGVEYKALSKVTKNLKKGTLKQSELIENGKYKVINSGRDYYGNYDKFNNEGDAFTFAARGEYAGFVNYHKDRFWAGGLCYPYCSNDKTKYNTKYLFYALKTKEKYIRETLVCEGSIPALNKSDIEDFELPIPPIEIQEEIVRILDKFTELTAELTTELTARVSQYEYYRDSLLTFDDSVVTTTKPLEEIAKIYDGTHQTPKYTDSGVEFISVENISNIYGSKKHISKEDYAKYKIKPQINDIFMTRIGSIGKCAIMTKEQDLAYYVSLGLIRPNQDIIMSKYLAYYIESSYGRKELAKWTLVNAVPIKINKDAIGYINITYPNDIKVQERIVELLDKFDKLCNDIKEGLPAEIEARQQQYEYYRNKLLTFKRKEVVD